MISSGTPAFTLTFIDTRCAFEAEAIGGVIINASSTTVVFGDQPLPSRSGKPPGSGGPGIYRGVIVSGKRMLNEPLS